jgi:hypothetical protein
MSSHEPSHAAAGIPLKAHVEELRSRCEAASRFQGGSTYFHEELGIFRAYLEERSLYLKEPPAELTRPPDDEGNEHQVWYIPAGESFLKASWPDFFGLLVIHRPNEEHKASPSIKIPACLTPCSSLPPLNASMNSMSASRRWRKALLTRSLTSHPTFSFSEIRIS